MSRDDIIRMAKEVGIRLMGDGFGKPDRTDVWATQDEFERFANLVAAAEREECAKVCEERLLDKANCTAEQMYELQKKSIAAAIRARGHL
jgi:glycerol dehydrogenase-like iron-containing ADH family enzyme